MKELKVMVGEAIPVIDKNIKGIVNNKNKKWSVKIIVQEKKRYQTFLSRLIIFFGIKLQKKKKKNINKCTPLIKFGESLRSQHLQQSHWKITRVLVVE